MAVLDIDGDGWLDIFVVNGTTLEGFPERAGADRPSLSKPADGTYEDVTAKSGIVQSGWGQARLRRRLRQ